MAEQTVFFSVIVPVYNCADSLDASIGGILSQTMGDIELIAVDDASTDNSLARLNDYAASDSRMRVVALERNSSPLVARKRGVELASGEYILFLDADDTLEPEACALLKAELVDNPVDIFHFGMNLVNVNGVDEADAKAVLRFTEPLPDSLVGDDVFLACFRDGRFGWNMTGKAFRADACKRGHELLEEKHILRGEDTYEYFAVSYFARSYRGNRDLRLYNYRYGSGADGQLTISVADLRKMCSSKDAVSAMNRFMSSVDASDAHKEGCLLATLKLVGHSARQFMLRIPQADKPAAYAAFLEEWGSDLGICAMAARYWDEPGLFARQIRGSEALQAQSRPVSTIGTYYHHYVGGGTENVQRYLIKTWQDLGYRVVVFCDNDPGDGSIARDADDYVILPPSADCTIWTFPNRVESFAKCLDDNQVDFFVYHYYDSQTLLWEMLLLKSRGIPTVVYHHNSFAYLALRGRHDTVEFPYIYSLADGLIALSETDGAFMSRFNPNVTVLPSPLGRKFSNVPAADVSEKTVLYLGRIAPDKKTDQAIKIFERVADFDAEARFKIVGGSGNEIYVERIENKIASSRHADRIDYVGWDDDTERFYREARVMVMTSTVEGYPLTLLEASHFGVPIVMFDLPYLSILSGDSGITTVPQRAVEDAAVEILDILSNDDRYRKAKALEMAHASQILAFDQAGAWRAIITKLENAKLNDGAQALMDDIESTMWDTLLYSNSNGLRYWRKRAYASEEKLEAVREKLGRTKQSLKDSKQQLKELRSAQNKRFGARLARALRKARRSLG